MTDAPTDSGSVAPSGSPFDFDALYRGESPAEGVPPMPTPPWDTKAPKESVLAWHAQELIRGAVLDIGCGLGDNAIYLATHGLRVTGLDISPTAVAAAEGRAATAGVSVTFAVADATTLAGYTDAFDTVVDSGMFHCLNDDAKRGYAAAAHRATRDGATLLIACFDGDHPQPDRDPPHPAVTGATLRTVLDGAGWEIVSVTPTIVRRDGRDDDLALLYVHACRRSAAA